MQSSDSYREILQKVQTIISPAYLVGGSVRDVLLGKPPKDYDFTTSLLPNDIEQLIRDNGLKPHLSGKRFGTIGCRIDGHHIEITTFRTEAYDGKSRKPSVEFVHDITADLARRDFTINAMAIREPDHIIDPFGGQQDLADGVIRAVNNPHERFREDPLRMLRAGRLAGQLGFTIHADTVHGAKRHADKILRISKERWVRELDMMLLQPSPRQALQYLADTRLLHYMIPELAIQIDYDQDSPYHELDLWDHSVKTTELAPNHLEARWAALLHDIGKPFVRTVNKRGYSNYIDHAPVGAEIVWKIGKHLRWGNKRLDHVVALVRDHLQDDDSPIAGADSASRYKNGDDSSPDTSSGSSEDNDS